MMDPQKITDLRALLAAGTPGPWSADEMSDGSLWIQINGNDWVSGVFEHIGSNAADAALITAAVNALPELLDEVERLRARLAKANANHEDFERRWYLADDDADRLRALVEEACEIGLRVVRDAQVLPSTDGVRLAAIRAEAKGDK